VNDAVGRGESEEGGRGAADDPSEEIGEIAMWWADWFPPGIEVSERRGSGGMAPLGGMGFLGGGN
jgi:hypothetical protein